MKIDISRDSFSTLHDYTRVLLQQGRPILDSDWNEQTAIVLHQLRGVTRAIYGPHGGPAGGQCGFIPFAVGNQLRFSKGHYTVDGLHLLCGPDRAARGPDRAAPDPYCTFSHQKYWAQNDPGPGTYLVYLEAMEREVTPAENPDLMDTALLGVDAAARGQAIWRILADDWTDHVANFPSDTFCRNVAEKVYAEWLPAKTDAFVPPAVAELDPRKSHEFPNQLFRYECHSVDSTSIWKSSRDNGFALFKLCQPVQPGSDTLEISTGTLRAWVPKERDWVELLTTEQIRFGLPGSALLEVDDVAENHEQNLGAIDRVRVSLKKPVPSSAAGGYVRVWNGRIESKVVEGLKPGDYWQFATRETEAREVTLRRPLRHYAPLGLVRVSSGSIDVISRLQRIAQIPWREVDEELDCPKTK
jgi:hypothetical protein